MRVSAFLYIYRSIFLNEPEEKASDPMVEIWEPNAIWKAFIDDAMIQFEKRADHNPATLIQPKHHVVIQAICQRSSDLLRYYNFARG